VTIEAAAEFFARAEAEYPDAPVGYGEMYLEFHRGTYTSQAKTKQGNRRCEHLLREAELWSATAAVRRGSSYPYDALDRLWKLVLLQQFHDILPGSSIQWVHREAVANYASVAAELESIIDDAIGALARTGDPQLCFNAAPHPRDGVPALGAGPRTETATTATITTHDGGYVLDNGMLRVMLDSAALLTSVRHRGREVLAPGSVGNLLQLHPDTPTFYDAWDIDAFYRNTATEIRDGEVSLVDGGVRVTRTFGASAVTQEITLDGDRVLFDTDVDWHEQEKLLKVGFDLDVSAERSASEIQFGHVHRPTHVNTSWDAAKFEICAHRFVQVAEPGYGVAVVNDSTYGHDITRRPRAGGGTSTAVRLSLLRAPRCPDPDTDQGRHRLRYALVPGAEIVDAVREGYRLNLPARSARGAGGVEPLVQVDTDAVVVESVKLADDQSGDVVVRLYEALGGRTAGTVRAGFPVAHVHSVDLLERPLADVDVTDGAVPLTLRPFQILTLRFARAG
jgi:alpha-mannosidase